MDRLFQAMGPELLRLILPLLACLAIFWFVLKFSSGRIANQHRALAKRFGLEFSQATPSMMGFVRPEPVVYGHYRDREVSFSAPGKGLKGSRQIESLIKLELKTKQLTAQMAPSGLVGRMRQRDSGGQARWKSGDKSFDQAVDVRTNHAETLQAALTDKRRASLAEALKSSKGSLYIGDGTIAFAKTGLIANDATRRNFEDMLELLCDFAEAVEG